MDLFSLGYRISHRVNTVLDMAKACIIFSRRRVAASYLHVTGGRGIAILKQDCKMYVSKAKTFCVSRLYSMKTHLFKYIENFTSKN